MGLTKEASVIISHRTRRDASARGSAASLMRFPCGHAEPEASAAPRVRAAGGRAVWVACQACTVIALVCARRSPP